MKPDQMQVMNPLLVLLFIPFFEGVVYPIIGKIGIRKPLQKIALGGFLAALAFIISAVVQNTIIVRIFFIINNYLSLPNKITTYKLFTSY